MLKEKYNAFISYSHAADGILAPALQKALEKLAKPWYKLRNLSIFRDESNLSVSPHLWDNIVLALDASEYLIYMASPEAAQSKWVSQEIAHWIKTKPLENLLIVLTEGEITWDDTLGGFLNREEDAIPDVLEEALTASPFYVDLRSAKTADDVTLSNPIFHKEVLKLAAHLHSKAPKDLASEEVSTHRKMIWVRNAAVIALITLLSLSIFQTNEAKKGQEQALEEARMRQQADSARIESLVAQQQAEERANQENLMRLRADSSKIESDLARALAEERRRAQELIAEKEAEISEQAVIRQMQSAESRALTKIRYLHEQAKWNILDSLISSGISGVQALNATKRLIDDHDARSFSGYNYLHDFDRISIRAIDDNMVNIELINVRGQVLAKTDSVVKTGEQ